MTKPKNRGRRINRRTVLRGAATGTGIGVVGLSGFSGTVGANGRGKAASEPCDDCGALLAKYEWDDGEFVFEKGRESLDIDGSDFDLTVTDANDDGEPLAFDWSSDDGIYDATCLTVKTGEDTFKQEGDWRTSGSFHATEYDENSPVQAISYVALCIECAFWQVDFGTGTVPTLYTEGEEQRDTYGNSDERTLLAAATHGRYGGGCGSVNKTMWEGRKPHVVISSFEVTPGDQATVEFEVTETEHVHFGVWEMPGPFDKSEIPWGVRYDLINEESLEPGTYSWNLSLPSV
jgi:hypothetical protein